MSRPPRLQIENVSKLFTSDLFKGRQVTLDDVSLEFAAGKCTGLLGHNGAGKTTLIKLILGLLKPDRGRIVFDGEEMCDRHRASLGYMPETTRLHRNLAVHEVVDLHLRLVSRGSRRERAVLIEESLVRVGLWAHRRKLVRNLSKGMGRRLSWVVAVVHQPSIVILDEPHSGLDPLGRAEMSEWIRDLKRQARTVVLCTHEIAAVGGLCDEFHILQRGQRVYSTTNGEGQARHGPVHVLHLSGMSRQDLVGLGRHSNLPSWDFEVSEGHLMQLGFREYPSAAKWLSKALEQGYLLTRFDTEEHWFPPSDLARYFASISPKGQEVNP